MLYIVGMGMTDLACEVKFSIGAEQFSIDVAKAEVETAKTYYQALIALSLAQAKNERILRQTMGMFSKLIVQDVSQLATFPLIAADLVDKYQPESYNEVFREQFSAGLG